MHDRLEAAISKQGFGGWSVREVQLAKGEIAKLAQHRDAGLLERGVVVVSEAVDADHRPLVLQQPTCEAEADEARDAGDEYGGRHAPHLRRRYRAALMFGPARTPSDVRLRARFRTSA